MCCLCRFRQAAVASSLTLLFCTFVSIQVNEPACVSAACKLKKNIVLLCLRMRWDKPVLLIQLFWVVTMMFVPPWFSGLRAIGCGLPVSFMATMLIHLFLSYPTQTVKFSCPLSALSLRDLGISNELLHPNSPSDSQLWESQSLPLQTAISAGTILEKLTNASMSSCWSDSLSEFRDGYLLLCCPSI